MPVIVAHAIPHLQFIRPMTHPSDSSSFEYDFDQVVNASSGDEPHLPHHIADEERLIAELPACSLAPIERDGTVRCKLSDYPAGLWIPDVDRAEVMEVPEPSWNGWQWGPSEFLLIEVSRDPHLPRLGNLTAALPSDSQAMVAGRIMRVSRLARADAQLRAEAFEGFVLGFLDHATRFWAHAVAPSESRRDALLAAVLTMVRLPTP